MKISTEIDLVTPDAEDYKVHGLWNEKKEDYNELKPKAVITAEILQENIFNLLSFLTEDLVDIGRELADLREKIDAK